MRISTHILKFIRNKNFFESNNNFKFLYLASIYLSDTQIRRGFLNASSLFAYSPTTTLNNIPQTNKYKLPICSESDFSRNQDYENNFQFIISLFPKTKFDIRDIHPSPTTPCRKKVRKRRKTLTYNNKIQHLHEDVHPEDVHPAIIPLQENFQKMPNCSKEPKT